MCHVRILNLPKTLCNQNGKSNKLFSDNITFFTWKVIAISQNHKSILIIFHQVCMNYETSSSMRFIIIFP